jgi:hypothetical protein
LLQFVNWDRVFPGRVQADAHRDDEIDQGTDEKAWQNDEYDVLLGQIGELVHLIQKHAVIDEVIHHQQRARTDVCRQDRGNHDLDDKPHLQGSLDEKIADISSVDLFHYPISSVPKYSGKAACFSTPLLILYYFYRALTRCE